MSTATATAQRTEQGSYIYRGYEIKRNAWLEVSPSEGKWIVCNNPGGVDRGQPQQIFGGAHRTMADAKAYVDQRLIELTEKARIEYRNLLDVVRSLDHLDNEVVTELFGRCKSAGDKFYALSRGL